MLCCALTLAAQESPVQKFGKINPADLQKKVYSLFPLISREEYKSFATGKLLNNYFGNSVESMFSFFIKEEKIDLKEADEIMKLMEKLKNK